MSDEGKKIEGHDYDGIEELDFAPPRWFQLLFLTTVLLTRLRNIRARETPRNTRST
jgi:hypothetical protein